MKNKTFIFSIILLLFVFIIFISCNQQKTEWQGTIEMVNEVTIIKNPNEPLYGELIFDLEEDLSIGNEKHENYMFYGIGDIQVDRDGNIYVLERGNFRIQKFNANGKYICTIGRQGQGPGEFQMPSQVLINDEKGTVGIKDGRKLIIFNKEGKYLDEDIVFEEFFDDLVIDSEGSLWAIKFSQEGDDESAGNFSKAFGILNNRGKMEKSIDRFPYDMYQERKGEESVSVITGFEYNTVFSLVDDQNLVYGYSKKYELNIIDLNGNLRLRIMEDEPYKDFTGEERKQFEKINLPEYKPFFYEIFSDSKGRIFVQRNKARKRETIEKVFDVFSRDGYYLYKTVCQPTPYVINDGYYYTVIQDEDTGDVFVKRFKIINWDKMKETI